MTAAGLRRLLAQPPVWVSVLALSVFAGYEVWLSALAAERLGQGGLRGAAAPVHIEVAFAITPEQYHMQRLQDAGRLVRSDGRRAYLMDVTPEQLRALARNYWIADIRPWSGR